MCARINRHSQLVWTFADEQGHPWRGLGVVEGAPATPNQLQVTLSVARVDRRAPVQRRRSSG